MDSAAKRRVVAAVFGDFSAFFERFWPLALQIQAQAALKYIAIVVIVANLLRHRLHVAAGNGLAELGEV